MLGLVVDVETTGLDWNKHSILQFGYVLVDMDKMEVVEDGWFYVKPYKEVVIEPKALAVNGLNLNDVYSNGVSVREIYSKLSSFGQKMFFIGWNVWFDYMFVQDMLSRIGVDFGELFYRSPIDVKSVYMTKYKSHDSLEAAVNKLKLNTMISAFHDAGYDALMTFNVWKRMVGELK